MEGPGDSTLLVGTVVDRFEFEDAYDEVQKRIDAGETELRLPTCSTVLLGITKGLSGHRFLPVRRILPGRPPRS